MPTGKVAAMVAHASMTFIVKNLGMSEWLDKGMITSGRFTHDEWRWLTELDPGLEAIEQVSFAKIVCAVDSEAALLEVMHDAQYAGLQCYSVTDSGYSHNKPGDIACCAIGPAWPEALSPVTGHLKVYR